MFANVDWVCAGSVIISGLVVVFAALVLLWFIVAVLGRILSGIAGNSGRKDNTSREEIPAAAPAVQQPSKPAPMPVVEEGISNEVVAVIAAAIAAMSGGQCVVRSVKRAVSGGSGRSPWMAAGLLQNTRPF